MEVSRLGVDIDARRNKVASQLVRKLEKVLLKGTSKRKFPRLNNQQIKLLVSVFIIGKSILKID